MSLNKLTAQRVVPKSMVMGASKCPCWTYIVVEEIVIHTMRSYLWQAGDTAKNMNTAGITESTPCSSTRTLLTLQQAFQTSFTH